MSKKYISIRVALTPSQEKILQDFKLCLVKTKGKYHGYFSQALIEALKLYIQQYCPELLENKGGDE